MRRFILAATAISALAALAVPALAPALASADVQRYQTETATLKANLGPDVVRYHTYHISINPCTNTFTGTSDFANTGYDESISGKLVDGKVTFTAVYGPGSNWADGGQPYSWGVTDAQLSAPANMWDSWGEQLPQVTTLSDIDFSHYKNHGDYVSSLGGGADAAHACIGMPINSSN